MRKITILSLFALLLFSCSLEDNYKGKLEMTIPEPTFDLSTNYGAKFKSIYEKYGIIFNESLSKEEYKWDWNTINTIYPPNSTGAYYSVSKPDYINEALDSLDKWFFNLFPQEFISSHMPRKIFLCDTLCNRYSSLGKIVYRMYAGDIKTNYTMLGGVSERFAVEKKKRAFTEAWLSIFIEKMVTSGNIRVPVAFTELSKTGYDKITFTNAEDVVVNYGILKKGRRGQNTGTATAAWFGTKPEQDFGDFVSFIIFVPQAEKELIYAKNALIKQKEAIVKDYFKRTHNIQLPYKPRNP